MILPQTALKLLGLSIVLSGSALAAEGRGRGIFGEGRAFTKCETNTDTPAERRRRAARTSRGTRVSSSGGKAYTSETRGDQDPSVDRPDDLTSPRSGRERALWGPAGEQVSRVDRDGPDSTDDGARSSPDGP